MLWPFRNPFEEPWKRIEWDDSFRELLQEKDDEKLCSEVCNVVHRERSGDAFDENQADLCLLLVWIASGILDNGGFQYLMEGDFPPTDHKLVNSRKAFEVVGLPKVVAAFDLAFSVFPDGIPPADVNKRLAIWGAAGKEFEERASHEWFNNNRIAPSIAAFIRRRKKQLLRRYEYVRKWPENPFTEPPLDYSSMEACLKSMQTNGFFGSKHLRFNARSSHEKYAWYKALEAARENHGIDFGPKHPAYQRWEKWYLNNRKRLVSEASGGLI